ncbi:MAG TPA: MBL fold metallo-hydrolase [Bryobacteraceae bacterium]|nr:MBL fold metallo-hydrolase [Bryobacteraceae bacterium]
MIRNSLFALALLAGSLGAASPNLDIYWIDAEGGASTLIVAPSGQSLLIDTANRTPDDRDAKRIFAVAQQAGLKKIDFLLTTHYHGDHVGAMEALAKLIPIEQYLDHGESIELERPRGIELYKRYSAQVEGKRRILKPGDTIPLKGTNITVVAASGKTIAKALKGGGKTDASVCDAIQAKPPETDIENNESVGFVLTFNKFKFLALGDLPWNYEKALVCPQNLIGTVDLYQTTHHGLDRSGLPQLVWAVKPKVAVMNNGPRKGGPAATFEALRKSPGLEDIWQGHLALNTPKEVNTDEKMIANLEPTAECKGHLLKASVAPDGKYTLTNARTGFSKTYASK